MDFLSRRTIRKYRDEKISDEIIHEIMKCAVVAPSGKNAKPYEFVVVSDREVLKKLSVAKVAGALMIEHASHGVVVLGKRETSDTWIEDCSIASTIIQLKAWEMGIGSCWVQMRLRTDKEGNSSEGLIRELLNIPESFGILNILALGYPDEEKFPYEEKDMDFRKVHLENYEE